MNQSIYPCIWFDDKAELASNFYCKIFPNSKILSKSRIVTKLELDGFPMLIINGGPQFQINPSLSIFVYCNSIEETEKIWNQLIINGEALMQLDNYPWSEKYGWLKDQFGLTWQIMFDKERASAPKILPALLFTEKKFGRAEEAINFYTKLFPNSSIEFKAYYPEEDENAGKLMYSEFNINNYLFIANDGPNINDYSFNEAISIVVECENQEEIDYYWNHLTKEGEESNCGWLKDKFGISWQIIPKVLSKLLSDPNKAAKVTEEFLKMKKFEIARLLNV